MTGLRIIEDPIPYSAARREQMAAYARRHYGVATSTVTPKVIALHFTESDTYRPAWNTFAANTANRGELPGTCAHYVIDKDGTVYRLVPDTVMCRHTIGLNHVAIGIEIVQSTSGNSSRWAEQQILGRPAQITADLGLVRRLQAQYGIATSDVVGHGTANSHPLFRDLLGWRNDHTDWGATSIAEVRGRL